MEKPKVYVAMKIPKEVEVYIVEYCEYDNFDIEEKKGYWY